ncbi:MAG: nucleotidyltransferase family protein [Desulfurococcales archaeon]|nr:nucleotidyltransferase family protein [Desulfurococcales archaeon]
MVIALILAGGYGKRLRPLTLQVPKPLLQVGRRAVIEYQLEWLRFYGITEVVVLAGYLKEKLIESLGSGAKYGVSLTYVIEDEPLGTGGALRNASHILGRSEITIVTNGDIITNLDPWKLIEHTRSGGLDASLAAVPLRSPYGVLDIDNGKIRGFREKPVIRDYWINAGVYAMRPEIVPHLPESGDIEKTTFPLLASEGRLGVVRYDTPPFYWRSIDTHKDLEEAAKEIEEMGGLLPPEKEA